MKIKKTSDPDPAEPTEAPVIQHAVNQKREPKFKSYDYRAMAELATMQRYLRETDPVNHPTPSPIPEKTLGQVVKYRTWQYMPFGKHGRHGAEPLLLENVPESYLVFIVSDFDPRKLKEFSGLRETIEGILMQRQIARDREDPWKRILEER